MIALTSPMSYHWLRFSRSARRVVAEASFSNRHTRSHSKFGKIILKAYKRQVIPTFCPYCFYFFLFRIVYSLYSVFSESSAPEPVHLHFKVSPHGFISVLFYFQI